MQKKIAYFIILCLWSYHLQGQVDSNLLINIHNVIDSEMTTISNPMTGSLVYNTSQNSIMQFNGTTWDKLLEGSTPPMVLNKTSDYTVVLADNGNILTIDSPSDIAITIPSGLPIGFNISIYQIADGRVTISGSGGVSIKNRLSRFRTAGKDAGVGIISSANNTFHLTGDLKL